jgi:SAM-dependent methyltransferase
MNSSPTFEGGLRRVTPELAHGCPVCGVSAGGTVTGDQGFVQCSRCHSLHRFPPISAPSPESWTKYTLNPKVVKATTDRYHFFNFYWRWLAGLAPVPGRLLDIGCGEGTLLKIANSSGWKATGIEVTEAIARVARANSGCEVHVRSVERFPRDRVFDLILMNDVYRHLATPGPTLRACHDLLSFNGHLVIRDMNGGRADRRPWRDPELQFMTNEAASYLGESLGFSETTVYPSPFSFTHAPRIRRFIQPLPSSLAALAGEVLNRMIMWTARSPLHALRDRLPELLFVFKK